MSKAGYRCADYDYKGFLIGYNDYIEGWILEPTFLYKKFREADTTRLANIASDIRDCLPDFKTLKEAKAYVKEHEWELKAKVTDMLVNLLYKGK